MNIVLRTSEYCCYTSSALSALIAYRLLRMGNFRNLTFINQMFVFYYAADAVLAFIEAFFLFKLFNDRCLH